jgi:outer membrane beta-barrel protein
MSTSRKTIISAFFVGALSASFAMPALAQDAMDIGVIKRSDVAVVQKLLYPKTGRSELGAHLGVMPFDAYLTTPNLQLSYDTHMSESFSWGVVLGGGYGFDTGTLKELSSPSYGVSPDAYRYLGSLVGGVAWSPIYAKMNLDGAKIIHYDVYTLARAGATFSQSILPEGGSAIAPTLSLGVGSRFFLNETGNIRVELHDDLLLEKRELTDSMFLKHNINISVGYTVLSGL